MVVDPISNLINKLKNASLAGLSTISVPQSKFVESVVALLKSEGFIKDFSKKGKKTIKTLEIELAYDEDKTPRITDVARVSKFSKRVYVGSKEVKPVRNGFGIQVISSPKGIITDKTAKKENLGGELLFKIW